MLYRQKSACYKVEGVCIQYTANNATILDFINFFQYLEFTCFVSTVSTSFISIL